MKRITIIALLLILVVTTYSQKNNPAPALSKQDYLKKSKKQKTTARIILYGGATLFLTGAIIPKGEITGSACSLCREPQYEHKNDGVKQTLFSIGTLTMLGSIPFFTASKKNNKRAISVSFKNETAPQLTKNSFVYKAVPSLKLKISL